MRFLEKWSEIHNTFKFFKMGRPPQLEVIENSSTWMGRLAMMNKVKAYYKKNNITDVDFSNSPRQKFDAKLLRILSAISKNGKNSY